MKALVLAGGLPQKQLIKELKSRGILVVLMDGNEHPIAREYSDKFYQADIFDVEYVKTVAMTEKVDFLITCCADQVLLIVAQVSEMLGLPWYIDYDTAKKVSDKALMKKVFMENGIPTSKYKVISNLQELDVDGLYFPLVVKPVDAYSSKGVKKVFNKDELNIAFSEAANISRNGNVIVEEFCYGEEISVDAFVIDGKAKIVCISNSEKIKDKDHFVIFRGRFPANIEESIRIKLEVITQKIADAFGIKNAPMLIQLIFDGKDISVLEWCARTGGAMKYILIYHSCGVDVIKAVVDLTMGIKPDIAIKEPESKYIVNDFIYCKKGNFDHIEGFDEMVEKGVLSEYHVLRPQNYFFSGNAYSSSDRIAGMTIHADSIEEFNRKHKIILENIKVIDRNGNDIIRRDLLPELV